MIGVDVLLDGAAVALFGIAGTAMVLLELVDLAEGTSAGAGTAGLDLTAGIVSKWRITLKEAMAFWQQAYLPPQDISLQWELFQCSSSIEYPWVFKM